MENRFLQLIEVLVRHEVRFIVVGGIAAVLQRVPVNTQDFDLVHDREKGNVARLLSALQELGAVYRTDSRGLRPSYDELLPGSEVLDVGGYAVRVLTLEKLTEIKRHLSRPKDKFMLVHLEAALEERAKSGGTT